MWELTKQIPSSLRCHDREARSLRPQVHHFSRLQPRVNTEAYRIQARTFITGSDGLANLPEGSLNTVVPPKIDDKRGRSTLQMYIDALLEGRSTVEKAVSVQRARCRKLMFGQGRITSFSYEAICQPPSTHSAAST